MVVLSGFTESFFEGASTALSVPSEFPCAINGRPYMFEPKYFRREFIPQRRDPQDDSDEPGEQSLSPEGLWRRSQSDWALGAGQAWFDEEESARPRRRFHGSLGVDGWNDRALTLLPETEKKRDSASANLHLLRAGTRLYVAGDTTVRFSNGAGSEQNATWTTGWTTATGLPGGSILDIATSGSVVYVLATGNSIYSAPIGTTAFTLFYNPTATITRIWTALGRLIASDGSELFEITATPSEVSIFDHPDPNMVWTDVIGTPVGFFASGMIGEHGEVRTFAVQDDGSGMTVPVAVGQLHNEPAYCLANAGPILAVGTGEGFRTGLLGSSGLELGPVVPVGAVRCMTVDSADTGQGPETFIWFGWEDIEGDASGLGRIRPSRFTEGTSVVAYASDIYTTAGGLPITVASISGRRYFGMSGDGFYGATGNLVESGTLTTGRIRYGMLDAKVFATLQWQTAPLNGSVSARVDFDTGANVEVGAQVDAGTVSSTRFNLGPVTAEWAELTFTLSRDPSDTDTGPELRWWLLNAVPGAQTTERILLPVRLQRNVEMPSGRVVHFDPRVEAGALRDLVKTQRVVSFQLGHDADDVYLTNVEEGVLEAENQWNPMDNSMETLCLVTMNTVR